MQDEGPGLSFALQIRRNGNHVAHRPFAAGNIDRATVQVRVFSEPVMARWDLRTAYDQRFVELNRRPDRTYVGIPADYRHQMRLPGFPLPNELVRRQANLRNNVRFRPKPHFSSKHG